MDALRPTSKPVDLLIVGAGISGIGMAAHFTRECPRKSYAIVERRERLEQLRALEAGMRIDVSIVDTVPLGVDTPADLERARALLAARGV